jgi:hypothetical protein
MTNKPHGLEFPFAGNLLESLELLQKAWGTGFPQIPGFTNPVAMAQSLPAMMVPTLDVNELDKRIGDLRAVEQWLALNMNMLRASIQTLEVQRNTIATLRTLGTTMMTAPAANKGSPQTASGNAPIGAAAPAAGAPSPTPRRTRRPPQREARPPNLAEMPLNPAAWWGTLQDQFTRIAAAAAGAPGTKATAAQSEEANKPAARKPPAKRSS